MNLIIVFYQDQVLLDFTKGDPAFHTWRRSMLHGDPDVYNKAYIFDHQEWWRMDLTPVLLEHVPKTMRALQLLLP